MSTTTSDAMIHKNLLDQAEQLYPQLLERITETKVQRKLPDDTIQALQQAGFFRAFQPKHWGGLELEPIVFFEIARTIASACPASAWVLGVVSIHSWQLALFDYQAQADVWSEDSSTLISSSYMPVGKVTRVPDGFKLSGEWGFSSGVDHCDWVFLGAFVPQEDGTPWQKDLRTFLVPKCEIEIIDDWYVSGLQGTGSKSVRVTDVFVPEYRTHKFSDGFKQDSPGNKKHTAPLFRLPFGQMFVRTVASGGIGMLTGALREFIASQKARTSRAAGVRVSQTPQAQHAVAQATTTLKELKLVFYDQLEAMMTYARNGDQVPLIERIQWRYEASLVGPKCIQAIDDLFKASGGSAIYETNPIQRFFNDIHAAEAHYVNNPYKPGCNLGGFLMGAENTDFFI
ncbi:flavin-dependent monooxygenase, oxygenase subunit HsaA-like [Ylistrum balloti]|uniref:flavin-dependent monooxygenase, oxygenase subunit HsaA-like n=1 Tax=Ylistrum balloti TaxID=509963 RepID=UPI002905DE7C|nr:flavin-dependent monooxygenase, oxygenase subunit HsaA-like [Ylistrum balloti]